MKVQNKTTKFSFGKRFSEQASKWNEKKLFSDKKLKKTLWDRTASDGWWTFENAYNVKIQKKGLQKMDDNFSRQKKKMCGQHERKKNKMHNCKCFGQKRKCYWFLRKKEHFKNKILK